MNKHDISYNIIRMTNAKLKYDTATRSKLYILTSNIIFFSLLDSDWLKSVPINP